MNVKGIDGPAVTAWMASNIDGAEPPFVFEPIPGGNSNLTYRVTGGGGGRFALRRPPLGRILPRAHDMAREFRVIAALAGGGVPVPPALGLCDDPSVNGTPFYVMGFVEGVVPHDRESASLVPERERQALAASAVEALAALHSLDPDEVGLGDLGPREGYVGRQLRTWARQLEASKQRELPIMDRARELLEARIPSQPRATVVHGDYRLGNLIVGAGQVRAVVDWELCTLGDPLADVGYLANDWMSPDEPVLWRSSVIQAGGFPDREEVVALYGRLTATDMSSIGYYRAFQSWRLAAILEGVYARYRHGAMGAEVDFDLDAGARSVERLASEAMDRLSG